MRFSHFRLALLAIPALLSPLRAAERPKLIVAVVVDQLRYDYMERFHDQFVEGGFKMLMDHGAFMTGAHYDYVPTITAPGHASVFSGAPPAMHGIIGNEWYDKRTKKTLYCCADSTTTGVGTAKGNKMSPRNFIGSNFSDELRMRYPQAKVVGISMKDRGAILPAGKKPAGAYWFESTTGNFVTSSYYMKELPAWVRAFNERKRPADFVGQTWDHLLDEKLYQWPDVLPGESDLPGEKKGTFPHVLVPFVPKTPEEEKKEKAAADAKAAEEKAKENEIPTEIDTTEPKEEEEAESKGPTLAKELYESLLSTPFSNQVLAEFAHAAIEGEKLGEGSGPDLLTVSFSAVDACGHRFGPYSQEVQDIVLRLDRQLAELFGYLGKKFRHEDLVIMLTTDHAVAPQPELAAAQGLDGKRSNEKRLVGELVRKLGEKFGSGGVLISRKLYDGHLYFNHDLLRGKNIPLNDVVTFVREWAFSTGRYQACYSREQLLDGRAPGAIGQRVINGYNAERGGDMVLVYKPYTFSSEGKTGTTHGSPYAYDTHVPVFFHGAAFKPGRYPDEFNITDIVPTLCAALRINEPAMAIGKPLLRVLAEPREAHATSLR